MSVWALLVLSFIGMPLVAQGNPIAVHAVPDKIFEGTGDLQLLRDRVDAIEPGYLKIPYRWYWTQNLDEIQDFIVDNPGRPFVAGFLHFNKDECHPENDPDCVDDYFDDLLLEAQNAAEDYGSSIEYYELGNEVDAKISHFPGGVSEYIDKLNEFVMAVKTLGGDSDAKFAISFFDASSPTAEDILEECANDSACDANVKAVDIHVHPSWNESNKVLTEIQDIKDAIAASGFTATADILVGEISTWFGIADTTPTGEYQTEEEQAVFYAEALLLAVSKNRLVMGASGPMRDRGLGLNNQNPPYPPADRFAIGAHFFRPSMTYCDPQGVPPADWCCHPDDLTCDGELSGPKLSAYSLELVTNALEGLAAGKVVKVNSGVSGVVRINIKHPIFAYALWLDGTGDIGSSSQSYTLDVGTSATSALVIKGPPINVLYDDRKWPIPDIELRHMFEHSYEDLTGSGGMLTLNLGTHEPTFVFTEYDSMVAYLEMDDVTDPLVDTTNYDNDGTNFGVVYTSGGKIGGALEFSSASTYAKVFDSPSLDGMDSLTLAAWVKPDTGGGASQQRIASKGSCYGMWIEGGKLRAFVEAGSRLDRTTTASIPTGTWTHVALTYDGANMRVYVNGKLDLTEAGTGTVANNGQTLFLSSSTSTKFFDGIIDDVRIYDYALSQDELDFISAP